MLELESMKGLLQEARTALLEPKGRKKNVETRLHPTGGLDTKSPLEKCTNALFIVVDK